MSATLDLTRKQRQRLQALCDAIWSTDADEPKVIGWDDKRHGPLLLFPHTNVVYVITPDGGLQFVH